jgi:hypothetical protein
VADRGVTAGSRGIGSAVLSTPVSARPGRNQTSREVLWLRHRLCPLAAALRRALRAMLIFQTPFPEQHSRIGDWPAEHAEHADGRAGCGGGVEMLLTCSLSYPLKPYYAWSRVSSFRGKNRLRGLDRRASREVRQARRERASPGPETSPVLPRPVPQNHGPGATKPRGRPLSCGTVYACSPPR